MTPIDFGSLVPCRTCRGTGKSRNPDWGDRDAARQRNRQRRHGQLVDTPTELVTCVECGGRGFMHPADADRPRGDRDELIARSVVPR